MNRFWRLILLHLGENRKLFLVIMGVVSLFLIYLDIIQDQSALIYLLSPVVFCLSGCLITANFYGKWSDFSQAASYLLLPATQLEKFLAAVFFGVVLFIPCFILFYFPIGLLFLHLFHPAIPLTEVFFSRSLDNTFSRMSLNTLLAYLVLQPLFLIISVRFKKVSVFHWGSTCIIDPFICSYDERTDTSKFISRYCIQPHPFYDRGPRGILRR